MPRTDQLHEPRLALQWSARDAARSAVHAIREFAHEFSLACQAAALADADHTHPAKIRKLYLDD